MYICHQKINNRTLIKQCTSLYFIVHLVMMCLAYSSGLAGEMLVQQFPETWCLTCHVSNMNLRSLLLLKKKNWNSNAQNATTT